MSNLQEFDLTDIAGLNTLKLDNSHYEIAIPGTDISFTLIHDNDDCSELFKHVKAGSLVWVISINDKMIIVEWIGDKSHFLKDSTKACSRMQASFKKAGRVGEIGITICRVVEVIDSTTGIIEFISRDQTHGMQYKIFLDKDKKIDLVKIK